MINKNTISQIAHYAIYSTRKETPLHEKSMLIFSTDVDVGSPELGILNRGKLDKDINFEYTEREIGKTEEQFLPFFIEAFDKEDIPITFAVRGQLTEIDSLFMKTLLHCKVSHEIGAHGFYHKQFTDLTSTEAEMELSQVSNGMRKYGIEPKSFIFPRNCIAHLDLLEKYGYLCYRGRGTLFNDSMRIEKNGNLYNVCPSLYMDVSSNLRLYKKILDISIKRKLPLHIWFHLWSCAKDVHSLPKFINNFLSPFLDYAAGQRQNEKLSIETMLSATKRVKDLEKNPNAF